MKKVTSGIAKRLKKLRSLKGWTQSHVAEAVGIELTSYAYYEYGKRFPRPEIMVKLAKLYEIDVADLHRDDDSPIFTLPERTPLSEIINLLHKKTGSIPEDIIDMAMNYSADDEIWEDVRGVFESQKKNLKGKKAKRA